jgi:hypothetical protein
MEEYRYQMEERQGLPLILKDSIFLLAFEVLTHENNHMRTTIIFCMLFFIQSANSQRLVYSSVEQNILSPLAYTRIGTEFWSSGGAGLAEKGYATAPINNPAGISLSSLTISAEGACKLQTPYIFNDISYDNVLLIPSYVSVGIPYETFTFALGYSNTVNSVLDLGLIPLTTESNPDGTGQFFSAKDSWKVHTGFGCANWSPSQLLSLGVTFGYDYIISESNLADAWSKTTGSRISITCGAQIHTEHVGIGMVLRLPSSASLKYEAYIPPGPSLRPTPALIVPSYVAKTPLIAEIGFSYYANPNFTLLASAEFQGWSQVNPDTRDLWQFHVGCSVSPFSNVFLRAGYFTAKTPNTFKPDYWNQEYLTCGMTIALENRFSVSIMLLSSKPFTDKNELNADMSFYQMMLSAGFSLSL